VYGFNPLTPLDLHPILELEEVLCKDGFEKASFIKNLHHQIKRQIERKVSKYAQHINNERKALMFKPGDWVWFHLRKDHFPTQRKSKLLPHGDGPFHIIKRINDNVYELDLPNTNLWSHSFNVSDLTPFSTGVANSWTNSLPPRDLDEDLRDSAPTNQAQPSRTMTRSMTQDLGLGQDPPLANASEPIIP